MTDIKAVAAQLRSELKARGLCVFVRANVDASFYLHPEVAVKKRMDAPFSPREMKMFKEYGLKVGQRWAGADPDDVVFPTTTKECPKEEVSPMDKNERLKKGQEIYKKMQQIVTEMEGLSETTELDGLLLDAVLMAGEGRDLFHHYLMILEKEKN